MQKSIYDEIKDKRAKQHEKWGEQNYHSLPPTGRAYITYTLILPEEMAIKELVNKEHSENKQNWASIALEEFLEVVNAPNDYERREELLDLAAVIVQQIECIDRNGWAKPPILAQEKFTDKTPMPFGKYKGILLANVPAEYLLWLLGQNIADGLLKNYIIEHKEQLHREIIK